MTFTTPLTTTQIKDEILNFLLDGNNKTETYNAINELRKEGTINITTRQITQLIKEVHNDLLENDLEPNHYTNEDETIYTDEQLQHIDTFGENVTDEELAQFEVNDDSDEALLDEYQLKLEEAIAFQLTRSEATGLKDSKIQLRRRAIRQLRKEFPEFISLLQERDLI